MPATTTSAIAARLPYGGLGSPRIPGSDTGTVACGESVSADVECEEPRSSVPTRRRARGSHAASASSPPPTAAIPAPETASIVSRIDAGPASPAWLLAIPSTSKPAAERIGATAGSASRTYGFAEVCGRVVSGDSRLANERSAPRITRSTSANNPCGSASATGATRRPSMRSPTNSSRAVDSSGPATRDAGRSTASETSGVASAVPEHADAASKRPTATRGVVLTDQARSGPTRVSAAPSPHPGCPTTPHR